jgi:hypothetical protein
VQYKACHHPEMHFAVVVSTLDSHRDGYERLPTLLENPKRMLDLYLRMGVAIIEKFIAILPLDSAHPSYTPL